MFQQAIKMRFDTICLRNPRAGSWCNSYFREKLLWFISARASTETTQVGLDRRKRVPYIAYFKTVFAALLDRTAFSKARQPAQA